MSFEGKLPPETPDERRMPASGKKMRDFSDPFLENTDRTAALVLESGPRPS